MNIPFNSLKHVLQYCRESALLRVVLVVLHLLYIYTFYTFGVVDLDLNGFGGQHNSRTQGDRQHEFRAFWWRLSGPDRLSGRCQRDASTLNFSGSVAVQILGLGAFDSTNSEQIVGPGPGICAVMGGASVTPAPPKFTLKFLWPQCSTNSGTWCIRQHKFSTNY